MHTRNEGVIRQEGQELLVWDAIGIAVVRRPQTRGDVAGIHVVAFVRCVGAVIPLRRAASEKGREKNKNN